MARLITDILPFHGELRRPVGQSRLMESLAEVRGYMRPRPVTRRAIPHLRCGVCQDPFKAGEPTVYLDDERCHPACVGGRV